MHQHQWILHAWMHLLLCTSSCLAATSSVPAMSLRGLKQQTGPAGTTGAASSSRQDWQRVFVSRVIASGPDATVTAAAAEAAGEGAPTPLAAAAIATPPPSQLQPLPAAQQLRVLVTFKSRDESGLDAMAQAVSDPDSPHFQRFLSPRQFGQAFGARPDTLSRARKYFSSCGLTVERVMGSQLAMAVTGPASQFARAFNTSLAQCTLAAASASSSSHPRAALHAPVVQPKLPRHLASQVVSVLGLDNAPAAAPRQPGAARGSSSDNGGGGGGSRALLHTSGQNSKFMTASRLRKVYSLPPASEFGGRRQAVAVATYNYYDAFDVEEFALANGLDAPNLEDRFTAEDFIADDPVPTLIDLQLLVATAPQAKLVVYIGENTEAGEAFMLQTIADDLSASVVLYTWGRAERPTDRSSPLNTIFKQMALQGQTVVVASGDCGSGGQAGEGGGCAESGSGVSFPANLPFVTGVGGTKATLYFQNLLAQEAAWPSSGGGFSLVVPKPSWQQAAAPRSAFRGVPDVALSADEKSWPFEIWSPVDNFTTTGGTAAAASVWAGFAAMVNQCRRQQGLKRIGALNPHLYSMAAKIRESAFNDAEKGSNGAFSAGPGWDPVTGWGSMNGKRLLAALCPGLISEGACCYVTKLGALKFCKASASDVCDGAFHKDKSCSQAAC